MSLRQIKGNLDYCLSELCPTRLEMTGNTSTFEFKWQTSALSHHLSVDRIY